MIRLREKETGRVHHARHENAAGYDLAV